MGKHRDHIRAIEIEASKYLGTIRFLEADALPIKPEKSEWIEVDEGKFWRRNPLPKIEKPKIEKEPKRKGKKAGYPSQFGYARKKILQKQKVCNVCGGRDYLMVHHKDKNKRNNCSWNLELLCFDCHKKYHPHLKIPYWMRIKNIKASTDRVPSGSADAESPRSMGSRIREVAPSAGNATTRD